MHLTKHRSSTHNKFDRPDGFGLNSRHEHQRHGGVFTAGTKGHCTAGDGSQDEGSRGGTERQASGGVQLRQADLSQDGLEQACGAHRVGEGQRAGRSGTDLASNAERGSFGEPEDARILRAACRVLIWILSIVCPASLHAITGGGGALPKCMGSSFDIDYLHIRRQIDCAEFGFVFPAEHIDISYQSVEEKPRPPYLDRDGVAVHGKDVLCDRGDLIWLQRIHTDSALMPRLPRSNVIGLRWLRQCIRGRRVTREYIGQRGDADHSRWCLAGIVNIKGDACGLPWREGLFQFNLLHCKVCALPAMNTLSRGHPQSTCNSPIEDPRNEQASLDFLVPSPSVQFFCGLPLLVLGVFFSLDRNRTAMWGLALVMLAFWMIAHGAAILLR